MSLLDDYIDTAQAAKVLGITRKSTARLAQKGKIEGFKRGRDWWLLKASVEEFKQAVVGQSKHSPTRGKARDPTDEETK